MEEGRPLVAVSSCLVGEPVRYNGGHSRCRFLTDVLAEYVDWAPVCPEMEIGLGAPRPTVRLLTDGRLVGADRRTGDLADHTPAMTALAERRLPGLAGVDGYVLKSRSPSCGLHGIPRYAAGLPGERADGQPVDRTSAGLFARLAREALPLVAMEEDGRLNDPVLREHFVERIFAYARMRELFDGDWRPRDLVAFHSRHKLQLLAHDPGRYRVLGRIVADAGVRPREELAAGYRREFAAALAARASRGRTVNALHHVLGPLSDGLDPIRRQDVVAAIEDYRRGLAPVSVPVALLAHHARGESAAYMAEQTLLTPFPAGLALRHHL